jgi:hypothetical protein
MDHYTAVTCDHIFIKYDGQSLIPVAARSMAWVCRHVMGVRLRILSGAWMSDTCECCVVWGSLRRADLSSRGGLSSGVFGVWSCSLDSEEALVH